MRKKIKLLNKRIIFVLKTILLLSSPVLVNLFIPESYLNQRIIVTVLSLITTFFVVKKLNIAEINKKNLLFSVLLAAYTLTFFLKFHVSVANNLILRISNILNFSSAYLLVYLLFGVCSIPILTLYIYLFLEKIMPKVKKIIKELTETEKRYLVLTFIIGTILVVLINLFTSAFSNPISQVDGRTISYDVIFTADNGYLSREDAYTNFFNAENDIRQPMFALFTLPFSIIAHLVSEFVFFVPQNIAYYVVLSVLQILVLSLTTIMLARLLKLEERKKVFLYIMFSISFPYLLFGLLLEQYVFALFYVILTMYLYKKEKGINYIYIGAVGTLLTSGILFPLITKAEKIKTKIIELIRCFICFLIVFILSGRIIQIFNAFDQLKNLTRYTGMEITLVNKVQQFTHFISSLFIGPSGYQTTLYNGTISYQIQPITTFSVLGIVILVLCIISAIINKKEYITKISFVWVVFSIFMLLILGWGTKENGLILYSLYFGWAYYILIFQLIKNIFKTNKSFKVAFIVLTVLMISSYLPELYNILKFAILYY